MARIFNINDVAIPVKIGGKAVSIGAREGWEGSLSASDATEARKIDGLQVTGEEAQPKASRRKK